MVTRASIFFTFFRFYILTIGIYTPEGIKVIQPKFTLLANVLLCVIELYSWRWSTIFLTADHMAGHSTHRDHKTSGRHTTWKCNVRLKLALARFVSLSVIYHTVRLQNKNKKLSCRKDTVRLLRGSVLARYNWERNGRIFCRHYRSAPKF